MEKISLIDKVTFPEKSATEKTVDTLLSPVRIVLNGQSIDIPTEYINHSTHSLTTKVFFGFLAVLLLPIILTALLIKAYIVKDRSPLQEELSAYSCKNNYNPLSSYIPISISIEGALLASQQIANHNPTSFSYNAKTIDFMIDQISKDDPRIHLINLRESFDENHNPGIVSKTSLVTRTLICNTQESAFQQIYAHLTNERTSNSHHRPSKIFLPVLEMSRYQESRYQEKETSHAILVV